MPFHRRGAATPKMVRCRPNPLGGSGRIHRRSSVTMKEHRSPPLSSTPPPKTPRRDRAHFYHRLLSYLQGLGCGIIGFSRSLGVVDSEYIREHREAFGGPRAAARSRSRWHQRRLCWKGFDSMVLVRRGVARANGSGLTPGTPRLANHVVAAAFNRILSEANKGRDDDSCLFFAIAFVTIKDGRHPRSSLLTCFAASMLRCSSV